MSLSSPPLPAESLACDEEFVVAAVSVSPAAGRAKLPPHAEYVQAIRHRLPEAAFAPAPYKLLVIFAQLALLVSLYVGLRYSPNFGWTLLLSVAIGHTMTCLAFLAHELSHNAIVRNFWIRYPLEVVLWGLTFTPATMWQRLHNHSHHVFGNTIKDPDRRFRQSELEEPGQGVRRYYARYFYPHRATSAWNPFVWLHFGTYINRHLATVFYPGKARPGIVTYKPAYSRGQRARIVAEMVATLVMQYGIFLIVGSNWSQFVWASPLALWFTSAFVMMYVWTNHGLNELHDVHDPLACSTSVIVPRVFDWLHSRFSYHIEHHVFPGMNSDYYPLVGELLHESFPERYHRVPIGSVWKELFQGEQYLHEHHDPAPAEELAGSRGA